MTSVSHLFITSSVDPIYRGLGRPCLNVAANERTQLYGIYRSWKDVASYLGMSVRTLELRRNEFNLTFHTYTTINDEQLCCVVREVLQTLLDVGESYAIGACRQRNIFVEHQRMRDAVNNVDPFRRALKRSICIMHRMYSVPASTSLWLSVQSVHGEM